MAAAISAFESPLQIYHAFLGHLVVHVSFKIYLSSVY